MLDLPKKECMKLPYYKMYPQDFDCDETVRRLSLSGLGVYVKLLNYSWVNDGLPEKLRDIAQVIGVRWGAFEACWATSCTNWCQHSDKRWRNTRQVAEIQQASQKSLSAKESAKLRWEKHANASETHADNNAKAMLSYSYSYSEEKNICGSAEPRVFVADETPLPTKAKPITEAEPTGFAGFWELRWRTDDRKTAARAFRKAASSAVRLDRIMEGARRDREKYLARDPQYRPMMATWLNKERWMDSAEEIEPKSAQSELLKWAEEEDLKAGL